MKLNQLTVVIKQVLKRPLIEQEKAVYEFQKFDFQKQIIRSARQFGRTEHILKEVKRLEEKRRIICGAMYVPRRLSEGRKV